MFYVERFDDGSIKELARWPIKGVVVEKLNGNDEEVVSYLDRGVERFKDIKRPLSAAQFFTMLDILKVKSQKIENMISGSEVSDIQKTFMRQRMIRENQFSYVDPMVVSILELSSAKEEKIDEAWQSVFKLT